MPGWRIEWNSDAVDDLAEIGAYITERNPDAAVRIAKRIDSGTHLLTVTPYMSRAGRVSGTREFVFADIPYIAVHVVHEDREVVEILRVIHTSRLWPRED